MGAKATGQRFSKSIAKLPASASPPKGTKPTYVVTETTSPESAIVYRLSGDYNPLHIDPSIGKGAGFGGCILHGLATYGYAARAVLEKVGGNDPDALKYFAVRFTSPVAPGGECYSLCSAPYRERMRIRHCLMFNLQPSWKRAFGSLGMALKERQKSHF